MNRQSTTRDIQRLTFVDSLHNSLKKQEASEAIQDHKNIISKASSYIEDGCDGCECVELLMIDGLSRTSASNYTLMALNNTEYKQSYPEYSFQFEENGTIWSSHDVGIIIKASSDEEAWLKAEASLDRSDIEAQRILSVNRVG